MTSKMYETATPLDLHRLSRQSLHNRYESDEEDVSESDAGGQDFVPSLVGSQRAAGALDSDLSADENSHADPDSDREEHLLAPFPTGKRPRPVSMDTVKRSSDATFADDAYVFDPEEEMVLELPQPDSPPIASNLFLQPAIYVSPDSPPTSNGNSRTRSPSPSSIFSVENAEIQVAKKVTMVEPPTRPALVFINSLGTRSKNSRSRPSHSRTRGNPRDRGSRMFPERTESTLEVPRLVETKSTPPRDSSRGPAERKVRSSSSSPAMPSLNEEQPSSKQNATINRVSEIPLLPHIPPSPHLTPEPTSRPRTAGSEKPFQTLASASRSRRPTELGRRPSSIRSNSNSSVPSNAHPSSPTSPYPVDDLRPGYLADHNSDAASLLSRACSPVSTASSPPPPPTSHPSRRDRPQDLNNGPNYNLSNILAHKPKMMRRMTRKHSASSSIHSINSLRSEVIGATTAATTTTNTAAATSQPTLNTMHHDSHVVRKSSQRRLARHNSSAFGGRSFMGLKIGKRSFARS